MRIVIGSRKSDLARLQSELVKKAIEKISPDAQVEFYYKPSFGDLNLDMSLTETQSKGVFTSDLHESLKNQECDLVVHSWKDLPIEENPDSLIAGTLEREDSRDLLFLKSNWDQKDSLRIFSSSPRREFNLNSFLNFLEINKKIEIVPVRGNIPTRFKKFIDSKDIDGFVVASAAVKRLYFYDDFNQSYPGLWDEILTSTDWCVLPESLCPSAAAQGALAIEVLKDNQKIRDLISQISHEKTFNEIKREREIHKSFGGGCHLALGVTIFENDLGRTTFASGNVKEQKISQNEFVPHQKYPAKVQQDRIWISSRNYKAQRTPLDFEKDFFTSDERQTFVFTRAESCPVHQKFSNVKTSYVSGLRTWKKLFKKGVWVNGCLESLGLTFKPHMPWESDKKFWFTREGVEPPQGYELKPAYKLGGELDPQSYENKDYFIWMSGELFVNELKKHPLLKEKKHFLGMGRSYTYFCEQLSKDKFIEKNNIYVYSNLEQVLNDLIL